MPALNEVLLDSLIDHQVNLQQYSNGVVRKIIAILNRVDPDLFAQLNMALTRLPAESFTVERLEELLTSVRALNASAYAEVGKALTQEMHALTVYEAGFQTALFQQAVPFPAALLLNTISAEQVFAAVMARPFQGRLLREWAASLEVGRMLRVRDAIRKGYIEGQTVSQMVQRVRGTRKRQYQDGIIEIDRRNAEAVVRTAVSHTSAMTRDRYYEANDDLIKMIEWNATLDSRTSQICRIRDGKHYTSKEPHKPIGHHLPWLGGPGKAHWQCRSISLPVTKSWEELNGSGIPEFSPSARESMDGLVPADTKYADWIRRQSAARQDEILGPTRGKLLRQGKLELDKFYNDKGDYLTLDQLRVREAAAFRKAGL